MEKVDLINKELQKCTMFVTPLAKCFECVVCRGTANKPVIMSCCSSLIGCLSCVQEWTERKNTCPRCSSQCQSKVILKGFDDVCTFLKIWYGEIPSETVCLQPEDVVESDDDFV